MATDQGSTAARRSSELSGARRVLFYTVLAATGLIVPFGIAELFLRVFPMRGIELDLSVYDDLTGYGLYPHATRIYRGDNGFVVRRKVNSLGYLDREPDIVNHTPELTIGFFGDSYTEARQVLLEQTFFRLIEQDLSPGVTTLAFGQSGFNTLQSYLTSTKWIDQFDIDLVVYVFVENDLGDQLKQVVSRPIPYPVLTEAGFSIDTSFRETNASRSLVRRIGDFLTSNSLVFATLSQRLRLLLTYGPQLRVTEAERSMGAANETGELHQRIPNENDPPSLWPTNLKTEAIGVTEATILEWRNYVRQRSKEFAILYIPRESELRKPTELQDSWKAWLERFCVAEDITFIDPTRELLEAELAGNEVFDNHFAPYGHIATANAFKDWLENTRDYAGD